MKKKRMNTISQMMMKKKTPNRVSSKFNLKIERAQSYLLFFLLFFCFHINGQEIYKYAIYFKSKGNNNPYKLENPEKFLSSRAIDRKHKMSIPITDEDLPVNPKFVKKIKNKKITIVNSSRWFNYVVIQTSDSIRLKKKKWPKFVKEVRLIYSGIESKKTNQRSFTPSVSGGKINTEMKDFQFEKSDFQLKSINIDELHKEGFLGKDIHIAVFDGGFSNVDKIDAFHHIFNENRLLGTWDFASNEKEVYGDGEHGTMVLGCLAGYIDGKFLGTAPLASYWLFRTEDGYSETVVEEYNWISAAEFSDSAGVDIINSSLGYTTFDQGIGSYTYADMNGKTAIISRGANKAVEKGILVVNSAGNSGNSKWKYIGAPADAEKVFSIGAIFTDSKRASFSSYGPTSDGRIKPNVCALGQNAAVINSSGAIAKANGTSFSSPIMCGATACLMQKFRYYSPETIMRAIENSGSNSLSPNNEMGFGIPDFLKASEILKSKN
jgi:serine protease AprX